MIEIFPMQAQDRCRIMPVGDSITEGGGDYSTYRYPLWKKLTAAGYRFEYVGSRVSDSPDGPMRHEGYSGKTAEYLASIMEGVFRQHPADIVLLHSGHNHFIEENPVPGILEATESMIRTFRAIQPPVIVLLAQVVHSGKLPKYAYIPHLNEEVLRLVARLHTPEHPVIAVNQAEGFDWTTDTIEDHVHPNPQGAEKMAAVWFSALSAILPRPTEPLAR